MNFPPILVNAPSDVENENFLICAFGKTFHVIFPLNVLDLFLFLTKLKIAKFSVPLQNETAFKPV